ncbi:tyrosine-type recombinase/integrase [Streptomyces europaeiscabiei]|uniref:tyrosine-type recombinase/integrase n=1 Tax=Streptomyces europaeiscabiei TaxID=146819 RepID=UPI0029A6E436|nr:tyrosine-type recombinase/integrase [Streptomyces europaeiscabiei]MDX2758407.1 tyrosine-type recombinase/integrase [Streptomyces europaeiscabiei]
MTRHGRVARTPVSPRDPALLTAALPEPRSTTRGSGRETAHRDELARLAESLLSEPTVRNLWRQQLSLTRIFDWLEGFPADTWQDRWLLSGSDDLGSGWGPQGLSAGTRSRFTAGLGTLIVLQAIRPSYGWLFGSRLLGVYDAYRRHNQPALFAELKQRAGGQRCDEHATEALNVLTRMSIVTGKDLLAFDLEDLTDYARARRDNGRTVTALPLAYDVLHAVGGLQDSPPTLREAQARGQLTPAELIDRHPIANGAVRDVLVHYPAERSAVLDYGSLVNHAQMLADLFWGDLQRHHPTISSLNLPDEVAQAWKQRVRVLPDGRPRRTAHAVFLAVRSFYLDLSQWSMEDPARWAAWAAPCPISEADIRGYIKETRHRQARMQQRTRTLVPVLPQLVRAAEARLQRATLLLQAARSAKPGEEFTVEGSQYRRTGRDGSHWRPTALFLAPVGEPGPRFDAECEENNAFWTWASIEVLRRTGARIEELLELTHLSLRQYQAPTGETVPLLQISPSKTDRERVIPADPDLVAVLARVIRRIKGTGERVPLLTRYDGYERVFGPPMPHLFQCPSQHRLQVISPNRIREFLTELALRAGIVDVDGTPLRFTPHDFRRIFSTETVNGGLPIHIAAKLLGHLDLNTTQAYVAVYPEEVIRHYRQFVDQRRTHRPSEEYREPSDTEWQDFRDHFSLRKVALGTCDRPYGTPCQHENACVRCPMLRLDLAQEPRLLEIETNTHQRLGEAQRMQGLGEVAGLQESLRHIAEKKKQADRLRWHAEHGEGGTGALS